jgi:hypothetical protein
MSTSEGLLPAASETPAIAQWHQSQSKVLLIVHESAATQCAERCLTAMAAHITFLCRSLKERTCKPWFPGQRLSGSRSFGACQWRLPGVGALERFLLAQQPPLQLGHIRRLLRQRIVLLPHLLSLVSHNFPFNGPTIGLLLAVYCNVCSAETNLPIILAVVQPISAVIM